MYASDTVDYWIEKTENQIVELTARAAATATNHFQKIIAQSQQQTRKNQQKMKELVSKEKYFSKITHTFTNTVNFDSDDSDAQILKRYIAYTDLYDSFEFIKLLKSSLIKSVAGL